MERPEDAEKSRIGAILLSLYQPGFGHLYARSPRRAAAIVLVAMSVAVALFSGVIGRSIETLLLFVGLALAILVFSVVDAPRQAAIPRAENPLYSRWYVVLPAAFLFQLLLVTSVSGIQRIKSFRIASGNMEPTLLVDDRFMSAIGPDVAFSRNDIIMFRFPENPEATLVGRVVALGGDVIELRDKQLVVNRTPAEEPWAVRRDPQVAEAGPVVTMLQQRDQLQAMTVEDGYVFVMGDNRDYSYDSRFFGAVPTESVVGRPLYLYWSSDRSRIGRRLDRQ